MTVRVNVSSGDELEGMRILDGLDSRIFPVGYTDQQKVELINNWLRFSLSLHIAFVEAMELAVAANFVEDQTPKAD